MHGRARWALVCIAGLSLLHGCRAMQTMRGMAQQTFQAFRPTSAHYDDPTASSGDPWVQQAGVEARGDRPKETANDPLGLRNIFMSEKARSIERNMGIE